MTWGESNLLDLGKVVLDVLVECELAKGSQWDLFLRPNLGQVEDVPSELPGLLRRELELRRITMDSRPWRWRRIDLGCSNLDSQLPFSLPLRL